MLAEQDIHIYLNLINENRTCRNGNRFDRCVLKYEYIVVLGQLILWQYVLPLPMYPIPTESRLYRFVHSTALSRLNTNTPQFLEIIFRSDKCK
jgi:hypothetical protein